MSTDALDVDELIARAARWCGEQPSADAVRPVEVSPDLDLLEAGIVDSLRFIELVHFIEEQSGGQIDLLEIEPEDFSNLRGLCRFALQSVG